MKVYKTKWDKINCVVSHLMSGPDCGWLILVGTGGDGKTMATNEAIKLWRRSLGEDVDLNPQLSEKFSDIAYLDCDNNGSTHKLVLMKKGTKLVKTIVHSNIWGPEMEFMAKEWNATVVKFERGNEPY